VRREEATRKSIERMEDWSEYGVVADVVLEGECRHVRLEGVQMLEQLV
jgi:hypothetical protein